MRGGRALQYVLGEDDVHGGGIGFDRLGADSDAGRRSFEVTGAVRSALGQRDR